MNKQKQKRTKIVATIGPASEGKKTLEKMINSGMNVARFNFSHGEYEWHGEVMKRVRKISQKFKTGVGILADLQGPRIRTLVTSDVSVKSGEKIEVCEKSNKYLSKNKKGDKVICIDKKNILNNLKKGQDILIEDGLIKLQVIKSGKTCQTKVIDGGVIKNHKGINIPGADLDIEIITRKDRKDLDFALKNDVDFVALSFVKNANDIKRLRKIIQRKKRGNQPQIIAKIERQEAIDNLDEIIKEADAIMVARGDLGIEMDQSKVIILQKEIISKSIKCVKPVIVATQMLNSMIDNPRPTRAEIGDVTNAVIDHVDAVMLSGESATGKYPVESVSIMSKIIRRTEESIYDDIYKALEYKIKSEYVIVIKSAYELAKSFDAEAICMISISGFTAKLVSHFRPDQQILVITNNEKTFNQVALLWGVDCYFLKNKTKLSGFIDKLVKKAKKDKKLKKDDKIVVIIGRSPEGKKIRLVGVKKVNK
ncbi:MAG TPA: pyruvate kinase [Candidatus Moranbacteria bacterium]|nr:pyruvate kinase [Candidatus Moranbacteria bacterium]